MDSGWSAAAPLPIQLPCNMPKRAAKSGPSPWVTAIHTDTQKNLLAVHPPSSVRYGHMGSELVDRINQSIKINQSLSLSSNSAF